MFSLERSQPHSTSNFFGVVVIVILYIVKNGMKRLPRLEHRKCKMNSKYLKFGVLISITNKIMNNDGTSFLGDLMTNHHYYNR